MGVAGSHNLHHALEGDVFVVIPEGSLGGRGEQWLIESIAFEKTLAQSNAPDSSPFLVFRPATSRQIAAHHAFDREHAQWRHHHGATRELSRGCFIEDMVDHIGELVKPPTAQGCENHPFAGNLRVQDVVKSTHPVGRYDEEPVRVVETRC